MESIHFYISNLQPSVTVTAFESSIGVAKGFSHTYSATFNIILWTVVVLAITVISISCGIWRTNPGTDSIIYRMTTTRMKRD